MRNRKWMVPGLLALCTLSNAATAQKFVLEQQIAMVANTRPRPVSTSFPGAVIVGRKDPLYRSDHRLSILISSLPSGGQRAQNRMDVVGWIQTQVALRRDPNQASGEERQMMQRASAPPPGPDPDAGATAP
ncbi:MAG: hypothetical protein JWR07_3443 [Nevskia sp.]|nr:hypothetical protein [Nevskia sp.]